RLPRGGRARALLAAAHLRRLDRAGQPGPAPLHVRPALGGVPHGRVGGGAVRSLEVAGRRLRLCRRADRTGVSLSRVDQAGQGHSRHLAEPGGGDGLRDRRPAHPPRHLRPGGRPGRRRRRPHRGDRRHPARDGTDLDLQVLPRHRPRGGRQLSRRPARRDPARADRAGGVALPDDPALGGRGLRVAGGHPARAADRAPRRPADVSRHVALAAPVVGGGAAVLLALVIGYPCLRLKGPYFAIAMLGLNEVLRALVSYFEGLTGGGNGLSLPTLDATVPIYYVMGLTAVAVTVLTYLIITSRFGLRLM